MKIKLASLIMCALMIVGFFAGCNLFETHMPSYLETIVASAGNIKITKEQLINGYYNYGSTLLEQGRSVEEALDDIIKLLIHRELLLKHIRSNATTEINSGKAQEEYQYALTNEEYNDAVKETWKYINEQLQTISDELYGSNTEIFVPDENTAPEPDFSPEQEYTPLFVVNFNNDGLPEIRKYEEPVIDPQPQPEKLDRYDYIKPMFVSDTHATKIWNRYIEDLREGQKSKEYSNTTAKKTFERELDRVYKINLENKYLTKFEEVYTNNYGFDEDGLLRIEVQNQILNAYKELYLQNQEEFDIIPENYGSKIAEVDSLNNYVYFGNDEEFFNVIHILVKFTDEQNEAIAAIEADKFLTSERKEELIAQIKGVHNTKTYARDEEGFKTESYLTVFELNQRLQNEIVWAQGEARDEHGVIDPELYQLAITRRFNDLIYIYGEDDGMINPTFEYVIGTKSSAMVDTFTEASRELYAAGEKGSIWKDENGNGWVESTHGYHFILYVDDLRPLVQNSNDIDISRLHESTLRYHGGKTYLEFFYEKVVMADYTAYESQVVSSLESGLKYTYFKSTYADLLK